MPKERAVARPDLEIYTEILRMEPHQVVRGLVVILGKEVTAYLAKMGAPLTLGWSRDVQRTRHVGLTLVGSG